MPLLASLLLSLLIVPHAWAQTLSDERKAAFDSAFSPHSHRKPQESIEDIIRRQEEWKEWNDRYGRMTESEQAKVKSIEDLQNTEISASIVTESITSTRTYWYTTTHYMNPEKKAAFIESFFLYLEQQAPVALVYNYLFSRFTHEGRTGFERNYSLLSKKRTESVKDLAKSKYKNFQIRSHKLFLFNLLLHKPFSRKGRDWTTYTGKARKDYLYKEADLDREEKKRMLEKELYDRYSLQIEKLNIERESSHLTPKRPMSFEEWRENRRVEDNARAERDFKFMDRIRAFE